MRILDGEDAATPALPRAALLSAARVHDREWAVIHESRTWQLRPFADIGAQRYSAYQDVI
jgi:hypothetical protein